MIINKLLHTILRPYRAPEPGDDGSGGDVDRGDDFVANDDPYPDGGKGDDKGADTASGTDKDDKGDKKEDADKKETADKDDGDDKDGADDKGDDKDDGDDKKDDKKKDSRIPVARHRDILAKEREKRAEVERQLQAAQHGRQVATTNEQITRAEEQLLTKEEAYNKALVAGDTEKATQLMREIRSLDRGIAESKTRMAAEASVAQATEKVRYQLTVERLEEAYPQLNPDNEAFDEDLSADVVDMMHSFVARRNMTHAEAIQKAVKRLIPTAQTKAQEKAVETKARVDEADVKTQLAKDRKSKAVEKAVDTSQKQPKALDRIGADSDKAGGGISSQNVLKMSQKDFNSLDEKTLARLRGDELA